MSVENHGENVPMLGVGNAFGYGVVYFEESYWRDNLNVTSIVTCRLDHGENYRTITTSTTMRLGGEMLLRI